MDDKVDPMEKDGEGQTLPPHLGGHDDVTHVDEGCLTYLRDECGVKSVLDVGCGPGEQVLAARRLGMEAHGVDGDWRLAKAFPALVLHDYAKGPYVPDRHDAAWCVEFLEHLAEPFLPNVFLTFRRCGLVVMTHALPGTEAAHHHVNCRVPEYWRWQFGTRGFLFHEKLTALLREKTTMEREFMKTTGMAFINKAWR